MISNTKQNEKVKENGDFNKTAQSMRSFSSKRRTENSLTNEENDSVSLSLSVSDGDC